MNVEWRIIEAAARGQERFRGCGAGAEAVRVAEDLKRQGLAMARSFRAAAGQVDRGERVAAEGRRFYRLFQARHALGILVALLVRVGAQRLVAGAPAFATLRAADAAAIALSIALGLVAPAVVRRLCPRVWTEDRALVARWVAAHAGATAPAADPWGEALAGLRRRELVSGVSLKRERHAQLLAWSRARHEEARRAVDRLGDALPLAELMGIGLPAALLLAAPLFALLKGD